MNNLILVTEITQTVLNPYYTIGFLAAAFFTMVFGCSVIVSGPEVSLKLVFSHLVIAVITGAIAWSLYLRSNEFSYKVHGYTEKGMPVTGLVDEKPKLESWVQAYNVLRRYPIK